jgi:hypothetical protein
LGHPVAGLDQLPHGDDQGQPCPDGGLMTEPTAVARERGLERTVGT